MPQAIRIWEVKGNNTLHELPHPKINLEERLEQWLESDISMLSDDYIVIGRQVPTDYGGYIDLLCLDSRGNAIILELKRGLTPREVTAQALDYASWVKGLSRDKVIEIANRYLGERGPLEVAFQTKFSEELPEILNESHQAIVVAEQIDPSTERIVRYLSDAGIGINVATVQHFQTADAHEMLAQVFPIEPAEIVAKAQATSKRSPNLSYDQLQAIAEEKGIITLYISLLNGPEGIFDQRGTTRSSVAFQCRFGRSIQVVFGLFPGSSDSEQGLHFRVYAGRLAKYLGLDQEQVPTLLPANHEEFTQWDDDEYSGYAGYFKNMTEVQTFLTALKGSKAKQLKV